MKKTFYCVVALMFFVVVFLSAPVMAEAKISYKSYSSPKITYKVPKTTHVPLTKPVKVSGYFKKSGTYVQPHHKTTPNKTKIDNYSTKGNSNLFTGKAGYKKLW